MSRGRIDDGSCQVKLKNRDCCMGGGLRRGLEKVGLVTDSKGHWAVFTHSLGANWNCRLKTRVNWEEVEKPEAIAAEVTE